MHIALLQEMIENAYIYDELPDTWKFNTASFSEEKNLFPYQIDALKLATGALYLYYEELKDYKVEEEFSVNEMRKRRLYDRYLMLGSINRDDVDIKKTKSNDYLIEIYEDYYELEDDRLSFGNLINRMSFWMATGSGKSLLIIKLVTLLDYLISNEEIPDNDLLFLAPSDEIIDQFKSLVEEYNRYHLNSKKIELINLKDFDKRKHGNVQQMMDFGNIRLFYYRSDNIRDFGTHGDKDAFISYRNYENNGRWYILLDEAHKGGKESSRQQAYFTIMARNGFLFNFSASFIDKADVLTTVYDFKLKNFIMAGYGKNVYISKYDYESFKDSDNDFADEEKRKIVLKSLITLCMLKKHAEKVREVDKAFYHSPLMVTLVDSVNAAHSDLELFFRELEYIANGEFDEDLFLQAREELLQEFSSRVSYDIGDEKLKVKKDILNSITFDDVLKHIFNSDSKLGGRIEVIVSSDNKELAFRLKGSSMTSSPFALIKIGDVSTWIKDKLKGYHFIESFADKNYFKNLDQSEDINILMGSRAFYEGWDSKRPNVINYINIGTSSSAVKYITQSLGRGVRIEPVKNQRTRLKKILSRPDIYISGELKMKLKSIQEYVSPLETLFVFGTNKNAIKQVINFEEEEDFQTVDLKLTKTDDNRLLLKPTYVLNKYMIDNIPKFKIGLETLKYLYEYVNSMPINVLLMMYNGHPLEIKLINDYVKTAYENIFINKTGDKIFEVHDAYYYQYKDIPRLYRRLIDHMKFRERIFEQFEEIDGEIRHFESIKVSRSKYDNLLKKIKEVYPRKNHAEIDLESFLSDVKSGKISENEALKIMAKLQQNPSQLEEVSFDDNNIIIKYFPEHYYNPIIYSNIQDIGYINGIINVPSEVKFIKALDAFVKSKDKEIKDKYDWWKFSVLNEHRDSIYIPYFDFNDNQRFRPDFIFWFCKDKDYRIVFVDPKSYQDTKWVAKAEGFRKIFKDKEFIYKGYRVTVDLKLFGKPGFEAGLYKDFWTDNIDSIFGLYKK